MRGAAQQLLYPQTLSTPLAPGGQMTPLRTSEYGTNLWPHPMYPASPPLILAYLRSLPFTTPIASPFHPTRAGPYHEIAAGYRYPILTGPPEPLSGGAHYYNDRGGRFPSESNASDTDSGTPNFFAHRAAQQLAGPSGLDPLRYDHCRWPRQPGDPLYPHGFDYEWPELAPIDREILSPKCTAAYELRWQDLERQFEYRNWRVQEPMDFYLTIAWGDPIIEPGSDRTIEARIFANRNRELYPPGPGDHIRDVHLQTDEEQRELEDALRPWAEQQNNQLRGVDNSWLLIRQSHVRGRIHSVPKHQGLLRVSSTSSRLTTQPALTWLLYQADY